MMYRSADLIFDELKKRGCKPRFIHKKTSLITYALPGNSKEHIIKGVVSPFSGSLASSICNDKWLTFLIAQKLGIKTPVTVKIDKDESYDWKLLLNYGKLVVKPAYMTAHGDGITTDITNEKELATALKEAYKWGASALVQQQVDGYDMRVLLIDSKVVAATCRTSPVILGDGVHTVRQLIKLENSRRQLILDDVQPCFLFLINEEKASLYIGKDRMNMVLPLGEELQVIGTSNIGSGGTSINMVEKLPIAIKSTSEKLSSNLNLAVGGIDYLIDNEGNAWLLELNIAPAFVLHEFPHAGDPVQVTKMYVDYLLNNADTEKSIGKK